MRTLARSIGQRSREKWEEDTKTHQQRRIALDETTVELLREHRARCVEVAQQLGIELSPDAFVFSSAPDGSTHLLPDSVSQRYGKLARRPGISTTLHKLRHYSATELIAAGVDPRTVAGRLGHAGGGTTTLRVYTAWMAEADQRASKSLFSRLPARPQNTPEDAMPRDFVPRYPYERLAAALHDDITAGSWRVGDRLPAFKKIASTRGVSAATVQRAVKLLGSWGCLDVAPGHGSRIGSGCRSHRLG